jgi:putative flippase GtrA
MKLTSGECGEWIGYTAGARSRAPRTIDGPDEALIALSHIQRQSVIVESRAAPCRASSEAAIPARRSSDAPLVMNTSRLEAQAYVGSRSRSLLQRLTRCMSVSVVTTVISVLTLAIATAGLGITAWIANVIATTVATIPSYYLNRRWTWGRTGASDPWREVLPFWTLAFAGLALSTISVAVTDAWSAGAHLAPPVHTMTLLVAHLSGFGVLWVAQFILLDRVLFGRDAHRKTHSQRLEVT